MSVTDLQPINMSIWFYVMYVCINILFSNLLYKLRAGAAKKIIDGCTDV